MAEELLTLEQQKDFLDNLPPMPAGFDGKQPEKADFDVNPFLKVFEKPKEIMDKDGKPIPLPNLLFEDGWELAAKCKSIIDELPSDDWQNLQDDLLGLKDGKDKVLEIISLVLKKDIKFIKENVPFDQMEVLVNAFLLQKKILKNRSSVLSAMKNIKAPLPQDNSSISGLSS